MDDDDDFGADLDFLAALAATDVGRGGPAGAATTAAEATAGAPRIEQPARVQQPPRIEQAPRIQQPTPQRMERPVGGTASGPSGAGRIVQPTPQALGGPGGGGGGTGLRPTVPGSGSTILVSPRQKGNPILAQLRTVGWEYSDVVADYVLGTTTCALFLSLKYHRLHPEYIFARIRALQGRYQLRVLLALVDVANHEEPLRELAKTSLVNQVTLVLCWSAAEAARYLALYKTFEHASSFAAIRGAQAAGYAERLVRFATVPRAVHKADAVALVGAFGSLRRAVLAEPEQLALVAGWGQKKVQAWRRAVEAPFRVGKRRAARPAKTAGTAGTSGTAGTARPAAKAAGAAAGKTDDAIMDDDEAGSREQLASADSPIDQPIDQPAELNPGIAAALARLREG